MLMGTHFDFQNITFNGKFISVTELGSAEDLNRAIEMPVWIP